MALKFGRTIKELLESISEDELLMWSIYFKEPDFEKKTEIQLAQLSSILLNVNGRKSKPLDFMFVEQEQETIEDRLEKAQAKLQKDLEKL